MTAAPRIICHAGPSLDSLSPVDVNRTPLHIDGPHFVGDVAVRLKDYRGPRAEEGKYARQPEQPLMNEGDTWSIAFQGRWKEEVNADEVLFGNVWQKPIKSVRYLFRSEIALTTTRLLTASELLQYLPYGTSAALRFMKYVDPSMDCDLYADKPWALSPLFATLQYLSAKESTDADAPNFVPGTFPEDITPLVPSSDADSLHDKPSARRSYFTKPANRTSTNFGPSTLVRGDFSHGFLNFDTLSVSLPGGLSFSLAKYWNGEPVVFSCQKRGTGETFFVVSFTLENDDGGEAPVQEGKGEHQAEEEEGATANDDVD
ncbi:hypothetical protein JCM10908_000090 [Rhodotorula pacifica]|uniref:DUF1769 domain-containing protein n=1 Tax=Rhodotorula pacifica TaxID=1495444 RepID=UPI00317FD152